MLKGKQKKLDVNKDGKISGDDFAMLKNVRMQKKDAMGKKVVKAESGKMITEAEAPDLGGMMGAAAAESADRISEVDTAMAERAARRKPLPMLKEEQRKPITPKERREKDIAKRAQKKMGGGMMMQDSMGYKRGGSVLVKTKLGRTKPTKMF
jgi:hypothetical protein